MSNLKEDLQTVTQNNCLKLLQQGCDDNDNDLITNCYAFIDQQTIEVLESDDFLSLSLHQVKEIIKRDGLCVDEQELFYRLLLWVGCQLKLVHTLGAASLRLETTDVRKFLYENSLIYHIRFPLFASNELHLTNIAKDYLKEEDLKSIETKGDRG